MNDSNSLAHTKWNCKYHVVFAPKYRRKVIYKEKRVEIGKILRMLCEWKSVRIIEAEVCPDHIHMLVEIPPKVAVSSFMGYLKGKSSLMIYEQFPELKYKYRNREFWCRGYYADTAGKNRRIECLCQTVDGFIGIGGSVCGLFFVQTHAPLIVPPWQSRARKSKFQFL